ncbi:substrate-binding domain-containing protein [Nitrosomonas sp.]|uniref:substrate-binding domain-containing protein n=1 Tax=Nitrosomonas sp. TaxID=42353 RepID=UPI000A7B6B16|nr:substrate-binding domain-containing protein [Nitrosomonas sp.]MBY0483181.1 substrate-binding domain-containing protein [Nitrosomonas sp.]
MSLFHFSIRIKSSRLCLLNIKVYFCFALAICLLGIKAEVRANDRYEIVINTGVSEKALSVNSLRSIFSMHLKTWSDGTKIRVFVFSDDDQLHQNFSKEKLNVFPYQLRSTWDRLVYSGTGQAPIKVNSTEEMLTKVATTPGAIGYLWRADINEKVNVLEIK